MPLHLWWGPALALGSRSSVYHRTGQQRHVPTLEFARCIHPLLAGAWALGDCRRADTDRSRARLDDRSATPPPDLRRLSPSRSSPPSPPWATGRSSSYLTDRLRPGSRSLNGRDWRSGCSHRPEAAQSRAFTRPTSRCKQNEVAAIESCSSSRPIAAKKEPHPRATSKAHPRQQPCSTARRKCRAPRTGSVHTLRTPGSSRSCTSCRTLQVQACPQGGHPPATTACAQSRLVL